MPNDPDPIKLVKLKKQLTREVTEFGHYVLESTSRYADRRSLDRYSPLKLMLDYSINGERMQKEIDQDLEFNLITGETSPLEYAKKRESGLTNLWTCFRKTVSLDKKPSQALARIAVDSKYWLWINGKMVIFEGQLKRGPAPNDTYYDTVDLEPYLQKGENTIAVLVWYFGKEAFSHNSSGQSGLVFDAKIDGIPLLSNHSWKARSSIIWLYIWHSSQLSNVS